MPKASSHSNLRKAILCGVSTLPLLAFAHSAHAAYGLEVTASGSEYSTQKYYGNRTTGDTTEYNGVHIDFSSDATVTLTGIDTYGDDGVTDYDNGGTGLYVKQSGVHGQVLTVNFDGNIYAGDGFVHNIDSQYDGDDGLAIYAEKATLNLGTGSNGTTTHGDSELYDVILTATGLHLHKTGGAGTTTINGGTVEFNAVDNSTTDIAVISYGTLILNDLDGDDDDNNVNGHANVYGLEVNRSTLNVSGAIDHWNDNGDLDSGNIRIIGNNTTPSVLNVGGYMASNGNSKTNSSNDPAQHNSSIGNITITDAIVKVGSDADLLDDDGETGIWANNEISITDSEVTTRDYIATSWDDINITNSTVNVGTAKDFEATDLDLGYIAASNDVNITGSTVNARIYIGSYNDDVTINDSTVEIGTHEIELDSNGDPKEYGELYADDDLSISNDSTVTMGDYAEVHAGYDITITDSSVTMGDNAEIFADHDLSISSNAANYREETRVTLGDDSKIKADFDIDINNAALSIGEDSTMNADGDIALNNAIVILGSNSSITAGANGSTSGSTQLSIVDSIVAAGSLDLEDIFEDYFDDEDFTEGKNVSITASVGDIYIDESWVYLGMTDDDGVRHYGNLTATLGSINIDDDSYVKVGNLTAGDNLTVGDGSELFVYGTTNVGGYISITNNAEFHGNVTAGEHINIANNNSSIAEVDINDVTVTFGNPTGAATHGLNIQGDSNDYAELYLTIDSQKHGHFVNAGTGNVNISDTQITIDLKSTVANGDKFILVDNGTGSVVTLADNIIGEAGTVGNTADKHSDNTLTRVWALDQGSVNGFGGTDYYGTTIANNDVVMKVTVKKATENLKNRRSGQTSAFDTATNTSHISDKPFLDLSNSLMDINNHKDLRKAVDQVRPDNVAASQRAASQATSGHNKTVSNRIAATRDGVASGDERLNGVWAQGFGTKGTQDAEGGFSGYDLTNWGAAAGADRLVTDTIRVGVSGGYAQGEIKETGNRSGNKTDVDSVMATIYGAYTGSVVNVDVAASAGWHSYEGTRHVAVVNETAESDYDAFQMGLRAQVGVPFKFSGLTVTPNVNAAFSHLKTDGYTETGAPGSNLEVDSQTTNSYQAGTGLTVSGVAYKDDGFVLRPSANVGYAYEFGDVQQDVTARFAAAGNAFVAEGADLGRHAFTFGVGVDAAIGDATVLTLTYQGEVKENFTSHGGLANVRYNF